MQLAMLPISFGRLTLPPLPSAPSDFCGPSSAFPTLRPRSASTSPCPLSPSLPSRPFSSPLHIEDVFIGTSTPLSLAELFLTRALHLVLARLAYLVLTLHLPAFPHLACSISQPPFCSPSPSSIGLPPSPWLNPCSTPRP